MKTTGAIFALKNHAGSVRINMNTKTGRINIKMLEKNHVEKIINTTLEYLKKGKKLQLEYNKNKDEINILVCNMRKVKLNK